MILLRDAITSYLNPLQQKRQLSAQTVEAYQQDRAYLTTHD